MNTNRDSSTTTRYRKALAVSNNFNTNRNRFPGSSSYLDASFITILETANQPPVDPIPSTPPAAPTIKSINGLNQSAEVFFTAGDKGSSDIFNYHYSVDGGTTYTPFDPRITTSPLLIRGLVNGTVYSIRIRAENGQGLGAASNSLSVTPADVPGVPTLLDFDVGGTYLDVNFTAGSNGGSAITNYQYSINNGALFTTRSPVSTVSPLRISGLQTGVTYPIQLRAVNARGIGLASAMAYGTPLTIPDAPVITSAVGGSGYLDISFTQGFNGGAAISNYLYSLNGGGFIEFSPVQTVSPLRISGLTNGQTYAVLIKAKNSVGISNASNSISVTAGQAAAAPTSLAIQSRGDGQLTISFIPGSDYGMAITNYKYSLDGGSFVALNPVDAASPVTITGLTNGTSYSVRLRAVNAVGDGAVSTSISGIPGTVASAPSSLSVIPGDGSATIKFTQTSNGGLSISDYKYSIDGTNYTSLGDSASPVTITGLTNGVVYSITLKAVNGAGDSGASSAVSIAPISSTFAPTAISNLNVWLDAQNASKVTISSGKIASVTDSSSAGNDFAATATGTITYDEPSAINSRPAFNFTTAAPTSTGFYKDNFNISPSNTFTLFMVVNQTDKGTGNSELLFTRNDFQYFDLFNNTNSAGVLSLNAGGNANFSTDNIITTPPSIALISVVLTATPSNGTATVYLNGAVTTIDGTARGTLSLNNSTLDWIISGAGFKGNIGEVVSFDDDLGAADRQKMEGYLAWKWGLQAQLPAAHPYYAAPPTGLATPVITGITGGDKALSVAFTISSAGYTVTNYRYSTDGGATFRTLAAPDAASPIIISKLSSDGTTDLSNGTSYSVIIQAVSSVGLSGVSAAVSGSPNGQPFVVLRFDPSQTASYSGTGTTVNSIGTSSINGTMTNVTYDSSLVSGAFYFSGSDSYIDFGNFDFGSAFTVIAWVRAASKSNINTLFANEVAGNNSSLDGFKLGWNNYPTSDNKLIFEGKGGNATTDNAVISSGNWQQIAYVLDTSADTIAFFLNGTQESTTKSLPSGVNTNTTRGFKIGAMADGYYNMEAHLADIRIYSSALTQSQITSVFESTKTRYGL